MEHQELKSFIEALGLSFNAEFVPFSKSRNAKSDVKSISDLNINWKVTITKGGQSLTTDYMQGIGHLPKRAQPKGFMRVSVDESRTVKEMCEYGRAGFLRVKPPELIDVLHSLLMDSEVLAYPCFEDWTECFGYESDSRQAEKLYTQCLQIAVQVRLLLGGDAVIEQLNELYQDY